MCQNSNIQAPNLTHSQPSFQNSLSKTDRTVIIELLRKINTVDATDEFQLVIFLKQLRPIFEIAPNCSGEIVKLLVPKVSGQLFELWMEAVSAGADWQSLHCEILERFLPSMRRREIEAIELERPQRTDETFSDYVEHLLAVAFALKTRLSEQEVIEIALSKCRPETRSHFSFVNPPKSVFELKTLACKITSSVKAEIRYFGTTSNPNLFNIGNASRSGGMRNNQQNFPVFRQNSFRNRPEERIIRCFKCNNEGHIAKNCRINLNWR